MLKLDPKNTELLAQKQTVLKESIQQTSNKLKELKNAQDSYIKSGGDLNTPQYRNLQREIINTENKLKNLKLEASNWTKASKGLSELGSKMSKIGDTLSSVGRKLTTSVTVPIVSLGTLATKGAIEFESAFTGVEKTVNGTQAQMDSLRQGIRDLSKEIPSTTTQISAVAEAAGQLGIKTEDILSFTRVMIDLGNSTNLSAEEAASSLAKFANVTKMSSKDYDRLGSTIVELGNNFATTEKDIVEMATRLAATGELAGLSQSQILSLATSMSSVGIEAEAGGSAMSKLLKKIQIATELGGKELTRFAKVAGMSTQDFKNAFEKDAVAALSYFVKGLNDTERNGKSAIAILDEMGLNEVRLSNTILSLANANDLMTNAVDLGNKAWEENTALTNEANKRYGTTESKLLMLKNKLADIGTTIGNIIIPYVEKFVNKIEKLIKKFENLNPKTQEMIVKIGMIAAAIGPVLMIIGKIISFAGTIFGILSRLTGFIGKVTSGVSGLSGVLSVITGPVGIVIGVIGALIAAFKYLWDTNEAFRAKVMEVWASIQELYTSSIQPLIEKIKGFIGGIIQGITTALQQLWAFLEPYVTEICTWLLDFWNNYGREIVSNIVDVISGIIDIIQPIWTSVIQPIISWLSEQLMPVFTTVFSAIVNVVKVAGNYIGEVFKSITGILKGIIDFITGVFSGDWEKAWNGIKDIFRNIVSGFAAIIKAPINAMIGVINGFISGINQIKIPDWVPGLGGKGITISHIPQLAKGGVVDSATLAMIGEGKSPEAVIPLDRTLTKYMAEALKMAGGNRNIVMNFYPQQMTEAELERAFNYVDRRFGILY